MAISETCCDVSFGNKVDSDSVVIARNGADSPICSRGLRRFTVVRFYPSDVAPANPLMLDSCAVRHRVSKQGVSAGYYPSSCFLGKNPAQCAFCYRGEPLDPHSYEGVKRF